MRPSTPTAYKTRGLGSFPRQTGPSPPPTPTTPTAGSQPSSPIESPLASPRRYRNFSRPLASQLGGLQNRYAPLTWQDLGRPEGGGYIQPLGPDTNQFSYVPASRGRPDDPSLSPRSSSPEPSEDDDDVESVSPRSVTDDEDFHGKVPGPSLKARRSVKAVQDHTTDEDEDMDAEDDKGKKYDRGRRRRSTLKASTNFTLEEMPSRSQERDPENMIASDHESLLIIQPDQYSEADTAPSRDRSIDVHNTNDVTDSELPSTLPTDITAAFRVNAETGTVETDTTDTDANGAIDPKIMESLSTLNCESEDEDREAWLRRKKQERRQKRWSLGSQKRSITQSIGSATDEEDLHGDGMSVIGDKGDEGDVGVGVSARRLRRRTMTGGSDVARKRVSLLFDDPPRRIVEVEEPESDFGGDKGLGGVELEFVGDDGLPYFVDGDDIDMDD